MAISGAGGDHQRGELRGEEPLSGAAGVAQLRRRRPGERQVDPRHFFAIDLATRDERRHGLSQRRGELLEAHPRGEVLALAPPVAI
jgi:hypothetical protein